jgi:hypothetical protein
LKAVQTTRVGVRMLDWLLAEMKARQKVPPTAEMMAASLVEQMVEMRMMDWLSAEMKAEQKVPPTAEVMASSLAKKTAEMMVRVMVL